MKTGVKIIAEERLRQVEEGYTSEKDDTQKGNLSDAAAIYALGNNDRLCMLEGGDSILETFWPWSMEDYKPAKYKIADSYKEICKQRIHELAKAGALIAAEIDRLQRTCKIK